MSAEERDRPRAWHQPPSMSELLASCAAADAVSTPPEQPAGGATGEEAARETAHLPTVRRDAA